MRVSRTYYAREDRKRTTASEPSAGPGAPGRCSSKHGLGIRRLSIVDHDLAAADRRGGSKCATQGGAGWVDVTNWKLNLSGLSSSTKKATPVASGALVPPVRFPIRVARLPSTARHVTRARTEKPGPSTNIDPAGFSPNGPLLASNRKSCETPGPTVSVPRPLAKSIGCGMGQSYSCGKCGVKLAGGSQARSAVGRSFEPSPVTTRSP